MPLGRGRARPPSPDGRTDDQLHHDGSAAPLDAVVILQVELSKEIVKASYGGYPFFAGRHLKVLSEVCQQSAQIPKELVGSATQTGFSS